MAHIHLGEGSFPLWALVLWTLLGTGLISAVVYRVRKGGIETHQIALAGIGAAASFAVFQLNISVWGGIHMNLTCLVGILAGSGTPQEVFYDDALLTSTNLHPPSPVRVTRNIGLDASAGPVTESELAALLTDGTADSKPIHSIDGSGDD